MITSVSNTQVKQVIALKKKARERKKQGVFLVEGVKMFCEAPRQDLVKTYVSETFFQDSENKKMLQGISYEVVKDSVFSQMCDTLTPQGILTIVKQPHYTLKNIFELSDDPLFLVLEDLQDPGNVGTIFRTAEGAGVTGIVMTKNCVDIYNPKTIRSTMGSVYRMPFVCVEELEPVLKIFREKNIITYAAHLQGKNTYDEEDYKGGTAFLIGNEGNGLSDRLSGNADKKIIIPMGGKLESLNASIAAALLMYEAARQRRKNTKKKGV